MKSSVFISTFAVASSSTMIFLLVSIVLAKHINCFCPTENTELTSLISVFKPPLNFSTWTLRSVSSKDFHNSSSLY